MKSSALGLAIAAIAFGASTIYLAVQLNEERAQAEQVAATMAALNTRLAELERARELRFGASGVFGGDALAQSGLPMPPPPPPDNGDVKQEAAENAVFNATPPPRSEAFEKMMRTNMRANNKRLYAGVGDKLGLSKEDTSKLINMLTEQQVDNFGRMREMNVADPSQRRQAMDEARREDQAEIDAFLGPSKAAALRDYQDSIPARQEMEQITRQLEGADATLTEDQQNRLLAALIEERKRVPMPQMSENTTPEDYSKAYTDWQNDYDERVDSQAHNILNTEQMTAYNEYQQWQKEIRDQMATRRVIRGLRGAVGGNVTFMSAAPIAGGEVAIMTAPPPEERARKP